MTRPRLCVVTQGCKPKLSAELLRVGPQTLRYWREQLDPAPTSTYFSAGRLLAYRILKVLIRHHFIPVENLKRCDRAALFECCEHVAMPVLARSYVYVDPERGELTLCEQLPIIAEDNFDALVQPLKGIVAAHRAAWELMGHDPQRQRQTLQGLSRVQVH